MQVPAQERRLARFGPFTVDLAARELHNNGRRILVQDKPLQILAILLEKPGELVTREELRQRLWPADTFVDFEHSINTAVKKLREALGESNNHSTFIETLPRRGYRFIAPIEESPEELRAKQPVLLFPTRPAPSELGVQPTATTSGQAFRPHALAMASVGVLVLVVVVASLWHYRQQTQVLPATTTSIAVLPFADLSSGHDQEYLSEGLAEEILNDLAQIPNLKVAARTSAFQFKGKNEDSRVLGQKLNVAHLLEGSVRRDGNRVRITVQLIKVDDGFHLWSASYDRDVKDIFTAEDEIAKAVTSALQLKLLAGKSPTTLSGAATTSPEAYEAFLQARHFFYMQDEVSGTKALDYANRAIRFDPDYAPAYALRAAIHLQSGVMSWRDLSDAAEKARNDTEKAIALDPNLADGYRVLSMILAQGDLNCREAETPLKKARDLAPRDPDNVGYGAFLAMCQGRLQEAVGLWKQELALDPLRAVEYQSLAQGLRDLGRYDEAHAALAKASDLNPNQMSMIHEIRGEVYLAQGRPQEALIEMENEPQVLFHDLGQAVAYHALGRRQESDAALARLISRNSDDGAYQIAQVYAYRGEVDQAFEWLNRAHKQHDSGLLWLKTDLKMKVLRQDPRYAQLLTKLNLPN
jgi:TolB-like protein/DNA-binding winged helix-turn-helix (wHTH) protein/Flp pilus assembly protein TadD